MLTLVASEAVIASQVVYPTRHDSSERTQRKDLPLRLILALLTDCPSSTHTNAENPLDVLSLTARRR